MAINLFPVTLFLSIAFSGYIVYIPSFAQWLRCWAPYASFMRWGFQSLVLTQFDIESGLEYGPLYLGVLGFDTFSKDTCLPIIALFAAFFSIVAVHCLRNINHDER
jgi:hypothetical protein